MEDKSRFDNLKEAFSSRGVELFIFGVAAVALAGFLLCSQLVAMSTTHALSVLEIFQCCLLITWIALTFAILEDEVDTFPVWFFKIAVFFGPVACMSLRLTHDHRKVAFWVSLFAWTYLGVVSALEKMPKERSWRERVMVGLSATWAIWGTIISVGTSPLLPYAQPAVQDLDSAHIFLDIRKIVSILFLGALLATALYRAFQKKPPLIPPLRPWKIPEVIDVPFVGLIAKPSLIVANVLLMVLHAVTDYGRRALYIVFFYFLEIGKALVHTIQDLIAEKKSMIEIGRTIATFLLLTLAFLSTSKATPFILRYLRSIEWTAQL
ncbi:MAG TPA: hypothetical protein VLQ45_33060, partial [Thermoanaerobaculia bacterium]|nr:hypothetical protein [Thermoanaerobaculia bacterium]